jgi:hypothetical protein
MVQIKSYTRMALMTKATNGSSWTTTILVIIICIQWILFTVMLQRKYQHSTTTITPPSNNNNEGHPPEIRIDTSIQRETFARSMDDTTTSSTPLDGVAVTIMYRAPKWFHLRYKVMIDNVLANVPNRSTWKVQIFINEVFQKDQNLLEWNPGLVQFFQGHDPRVIVTPLPTNLTSRHSKPKDVVFSSWFWENIIADRVLLFTGNGAFCGNQVADVWTRNELLDLDYLGVPSYDFDGIGGDGSSHSLRNRRVMMRIIQYRNDNGIHQFNHPEHHETLKTMLQMNDKMSSDGTYIPFKVASKEQTIAFGGVHGISDTATEGVIRLPIVVAGTQDRLTYAERDTLLKHCPELKIIFPSLHEPSCFGAHPVAETCQATICALNAPAHGC